MSKNLNILVLAALVTLGLTIETSAQTRRKRSTRRAPATRQQRTAPPVIQPEIISLGADEFGSETNNSNANSTNQTASSNQNTSARPNQNARRAQNAARTNQPAADNDAGLKDLERLTQAEERAENLRQQLAASLEKESALQSRIEELDFAMRPENIERETAGIGSLRPEQVRESRRRQLENEKTRTNEQLTRLLDSRAKLESAIANFDALIGKLRARVDANNENSTNANNQNNNPIVINEPNNQNTVRPDNTPPE